MAFSKTPQTSTYQTKEVSLLNEWESRDSTLAYDNDAVNCFYEVFKNNKVGDQDQIVVKRNGTVAYPYVAAASTVRGLHYWEDQDKLFIATGTNIAIVTASTGVIVTTLAAAFGTSSGDVGFEEFLYDTNNTKIVATDGTTMITIDSSNTKVVVTSVNLPVPHLPYPVFLDGYLFVVKTDTADIYNSDLNDPTLWTAGNFITAEMSADKISRLAKLNNYILALGSGGIEYFFDAANATGSPLQRYDTPYKYIGYTGGFASWGNDILFVGNSKDSGIQVYKASDLKIEPISNPPLNRALTSDSITGAVVASYAGHDFYIISIGSYTYQVNLMNKTWTRLAFKAETGFVMTKAAYINITGVGYATLVVRSGDTTMYYFKPTVYADNTVAFTTTVVTDPQYFDTYRLKTCSRLLIVCDRPSASADLNISWSDDDYQTYSTPRAVDVNVQFPHLSQLGQFRRRAFKLTYSANYPLRLRKMELDLNMGQA